MISKNTQGDLRAELQRLNEMRHAIGKKIESIRDILTPLPGVVTPESRSGTERLCEDDNSFAFKIRAALVSIGQSATTKDVVAVLNQHGLSPNGKTSTSSVVSAELNRMSKRGTGGVKRVKGKRGRYRIESNGEH